eukprot:jgi/Chlat1/7134/Chrsp57S06813
MALVAGAAAAGVALTSPCCLSSGLCACRSQRRRVGVKGASAGKGSLRADFYGRSLSASQKSGSSSVVARRRPAQVVRCAQAGNVVDGEAPLGPIPRRHEEFNFSRWLRHRSDTRHWRHVFTIGDSRVFQRVALPCLTLTGLAALVPVADKVLHLPLPVIPATPFTLTSAVLGLLLVFRTNASYDRYWEGRKLWALLLQRSRDVSRQAMNWIEDEKLRDMYVRYSAALPWTLKCHLRKGEDPANHVKELLQDDELQALLNSKHRPIHMTQVVTEILRQAGLTEYQFITMDHNVTVYADVMGACERILRCPIPVSYTRHTSRFLLVYCALLPLVFYHDFGPAVIPAIFLLTYALFGIEEIGVTIEEPFHLLPLELICAEIETSIKESYSAKDNSQIILAETLQA